MNKISYRISYIEIVLILFFVLIATIYILTGATVGVTGSHSWRQADTYGHILGFMEYKNFQPFDSFIMGKKNVFDIPIYQWIIAKVALLTHFDPLVVTSVFNYLLWVITSLSGYMIANMLGKRFAGLSFLFFMVTSPLILHYYSVPLPDTLSIALSMVAIAILFYYGIVYRSVLLSTPLLIIATLIKSPIVFIFILFYLSYALFVKDIYFSTHISTTIKKNLSLLLLFVILLASAIVAELLRKYLVGGLEGFGFAQDPSWYFGDWELRTRVFFWQKMLNDLDESGIYPFSVIYLTIVLVSVFLERSRTLFAVLFSAILSFFAGWLIFSNLYAHHDYYKLPATVVLFISVSVSLSYIIHHLQTKHMHRKIYFLKPTIILLTIIATLYIVSVQYYISNREQARVFSQAKDTLKPYDTFLHIGGASQDPSLGALLGTKYKTMDTREFNRNCLRSLYKYQAIVAKKENACLKRYRYLFNNIVELGDTKVLYTIELIEPNSTVGE